MSVGSRIDVASSDFADMLTNCQKGDVFLLGTLLKGLSDEKIAWLVLERVATDASIRVTLHAYWHDVFLVSKVVTLIGSTLYWGDTMITEVPSE